MRDVMIMPLGPIFFLYKCVSPHAAYFVIPELCDTWDLEVKCLLVEIKRTNLKRRL